MRISNKWKYHIDIKSLFEDTTTPELIVKLCDCIIPQLNRILNAVTKSNLIEDDIYRLEINILEIIDNFDFLKSLADGSIPEEEWDDYCFDGDYESMFNNYLKELYDLGDKRVIQTNDMSIKFMWIN